MTPPSAAAKAMIEAGVVGFAFDSPRTFKSGLIAPVYLDNRKLMFHPQAWHAVIDSLAGVLRGLYPDGDVVVAGVETAGIPHSSALAYAMGLPAVFVRKEAKGHGLQQRVEGGSVAGRRVVLLEDQITTGGSSLSAVSALRSEGAEVPACLALTSYGFSAAQIRFEQANVALHVLAPFALLFEHVRETLTGAEQESVERWLADPAGWMTGGIA
ncbi:MAG: orotate phosphoribosyltransferase [Chloroflexi bacterium]|nr:orotate phosphoribosyltransferase [Chloroflexota bacterium]